MHGGGPCSPKGRKLPGLLPLDRLGSVRWSVSWDWLSGDSAVVWLVRERVEDYRQRQASSGLFDTYMNTYLPRKLLEYGFHLGIWVPALFTLVLCGRQEREGLL